MGQRLGDGETALRGAELGAEDGQRDVVAGLGLWPKRRARHCEATLVVPQRSEGLSLAVNDLVERNTDNTGRGFDVDAWAMPAVSTPPTPVPSAAAATAPEEPPFPEVHIVATSTQKVIIADKVYTIVRELGAVTYQILVTDAAGAPPPPPGGKGYLVWLLLLLIIVIIAVLFGLRKRKTA